ncbi:MAG: hypothetical protein AAFV90_14220 [Cyanobacteria bacterium J06634_5]
MSRVVIISFASLLLVGAFGVFADDFGGLREVGGGYGYLRADSTVEQIGAFT